MKLLDDDLLKEFNDQGFTDGMEPSEIRIIVKFFVPGTSVTFYATEYIPEERVFFGFVSLWNDPNCDELGYFSLDQIEKLKNPILDIPIERDLYFGIHYLDEVLKGERP